MHTCKAILCSLGYFPPLDVGVHISLLAIINLTFIHKMLFLRTSHAWLLFTCAVGVRQISISSLLFNFFFTYLSTLVFYSGKTSFSMDNLIHIHQAVLGWYEV